MGLDMYLYKAVYIGANYNHNNIDGEVTLYRGNHKIDINKNKITYILEDYAYWRKANQIHRWFVDNMQDGVDNCAAYFYVSGYHILELLECCKKVKENHDLAEELLPTQSGFFFGSTEYDESYFQDIDDTIEMLRDVKEDDNFFYNASW